MSTLEREIIEKFHRLDPSSKMRVLEQLHEEVTSAQVEETITDEELAELMEPGEPLTGAEILAIMKQDTTPTAWDNAPDGLTWVQQQRETRRKRIWDDPNA